MDRRHSDASASLPRHPSNASLSLSSGSQRKERGAIAAQACDTCRSRKQKCDEQRPKCGTCQKFNLECNYREPQPTKKDKTLVEILDRIKSLEGKIDTLSIHSPLVASRLASTPTGVAAFNQLHPSLPPTSPGILTPLGAAPTLLLSDAPETVPSLRGDGQYGYVSSVYQMLAWPVVRQLLESTQSKLCLDPPAFVQDSPALCLGLLDRSQRLPVDTTGSDAQGSSLGIPINPPGTISLGISDLTWDAMQQLSKSYFDTFNLLYPILDRQSFQSETMALVFNNGFDEEMASTLALLVFALGEVAIAGTRGIPVHVFNGRPSGVKGGTASRPPGLTLFNEARRRMGFNLADCSLENVQIFALASLYYGSCCRHLEFWRMTTSASLACQALITRSVHLELGFPLTGLEKFEPIVGLPDFSGPFNRDDYLGNESSHFQEHFASQIVLRRLLVDFHNTLSQASSSPSALASTALPLTAFSDSPPRDPLSHATIQQLALQLEQWHGMLPAALKWPEDNPSAFPSTASEAYDPGSGVGHVPSHLMFSTDLDAPPAVYPYVLDLQAALLRARYYHVKYLIHRPFLYKALHHPDVVTHEDAVGVATCLRSALRWPVALSPACARKRLMPCLFFWTQNLLGVLIVLRLSERVPLLRRVRATLCGERFEIEARETVGLCIDWVRDLRDVDAAAAWAWGIVKGLYGLED
ncbi:hypothetical protein VTK73DRAFT_2257 [Phialemonium thermophilum]|uniref:Zn(2)-C6 fungal-type domain-containing protein n=1 Tax=Phialemonium thermophilum TaxID=223376 RepID=A0ABR3X5Q8_9PEZI